MENIIDGVLDGVFGGADTVAVIGAGNIGGSIVKGLVRGKFVEAKRITCSDICAKALDGLKAFDDGIVTTKDNKRAVRGARVVIIAVKPWVVESVIDDIKTALDYEKQIVVSIAAGVTFEQLLASLSKPAGRGRVTPSLFRVIPNTAVEVLSSMTFVAASDASGDDTALVMGLFRRLGNALLIDERLMAAGTALASSGIAFALRYIRASIEGGVELGFYPHEAQEIVLHTVKGAVDLLLGNNSNPEEEIDRVTTPGGITIRGLNEMEMSGFTSSVIRGLKASR
ncbi:MAG: pyrroline-5-carboxylate reductase [Tannerellaceae bacterium]|nr:pyrroline-5-carboxylate reductase [Tannerellaceae bacterium]